MTKKTVSPEAAARPADPQIVALTGLIRLEQRIRASNLPELRFVAVNETIALSHYQQAVLWECPSGDAKQGKITMASGVSQPAADSPYIEYLHRMLRILAPSLDTPQVITSKSLARPKLAAGWEQWLPANLYWQPLAYSGSSWRGGLLLMRAEPWGEREAALMKLAADAYAHRFCELTRREAPSAWSNIGHMLLKRKMLYVIALLCALPVHTSVLAPAEVIAESPILIRAPVEGVIASIAVQPNQHVKAGELLLSFDKAELATKLNVAQKTQEVAELELRQTMEAAMNDSEARNAVAAAKGKVEQAKADAAYYSDMLARTDVTAPEDGVVVFEDVYDWLGRPVNIGERIMMLATPSHTQVEISLPANEWMAFPDQAPVSFFSNVTPYAPGHATLYYSSYRSSETPEGTVAYRLRAKWSGDAANLRLGEKGTAAIYGYRQPLIWHMLHRPLAIVRQWLGW